MAGELSKDVPELNEKITFYKADGSVQNTVGMTTRILFLLATEGKVIRVRPKGTWVSAMYRWAPMDEWLGGPIPEISKAEAQVGSPTEVAEHIWPRDRARHEMVDWMAGYPGACSPGDDRRRRSRAGAGYGISSYPMTSIGYHRSPRGLALLPSLDPTTMGWKEREWYLGPHAPRLFDSNGNAGQTIWVDGKIVGAWGQRVSGEVVWELLEDIGHESLERGRASGGGTRDLAQ